MDTSVGSNKMSFTMENDNIEMFSPVQIIKFILIGSILAVHSKSGGPKGANVICLLVFRLI